MKLLKAKYSSNDFHDGETEFFNMDQILNIQPYNNGTAKILIGAGLYWNVYIDSMQIIEITPENVRDVIGGGGK